MNSIYEIYIPVKDQPQADRLKAICLEYGLPIWDDDLAFVYDPNEINSFLVGENRNDKQFLVAWSKRQQTDKTESNEEEFVKLLKEMKK